MSVVIYSLYASLTLTALIMTLLAFKSQSDSSMSIATWSNILAILILYQLAGGEILGLFFGYSNAFLYSVNLLLLVVAVSYLLLHSESIKTSRVMGGMLWSIALIVIFAGLLLLSNVWINAHFIEHRKQGKPILQVATLGKNPHCSYRYIFYKMQSDGQVGYLCPNYYGLIPRVGQLETTPEFLKHQFR
ncbi:MAG: type I secretion system protein LssZ [Legionellaceae bacterium]|nr:type I secretion system protein LssZ [Legionellaceae bacterium]